MPTHPLAVRFVTGRQCNDYGYVLRTFTQDVARILIEAGADLEVGGPLLAVPTEGGADHMNAALLHVS